MGTTPFEVGDAVYFTVDTAYIEGKISKITLQTIHRNFILYTVRDRFGRCYYALEEQLNLLPTKQTYGF